MNKIEQNIIKSKINKKMENNINNDRTVNYKYYENFKNIFFKKGEHLFLFYTINFILLNINGILCYSFIIVKINKSGYYNIFFNEDIDGKNFCFSNSVNIPNLMTINEVPIINPV